MACRRPGDKPLSEPIMVSLLTHICVTRPQLVYRHCCWALVGLFPTGDRRGSLGSPRTRAASGHEAKAESKDKKPEGEKTAEKADDKTKKESPKVAEKKDAEKKDTKETPTKDHSKEGEKKTADKPDVKKSTEKTPDAKDSEKKESPRKPSQSRDSAPKKNEEQKEKDVLSLQKIKVT